MAEDAIAAAIATASNELTYLFDTNKVPRDIQAALIQLGFDDANVFAMFGDTATEIREQVASQLGLKKDLGIKLRAIQARVLTAWEAANLRGTKRRAEEAEQRACDLPRTRPNYLLRAISPPC